MESISTPPHIDYLKDFNHYTTEFGDDFKSSLNQFQHDLMLHWREKKNKKLVFQFKLSRCSKTNRLAQDMRQ